MNKPIEQVFLSCYCKDCLLNDNKQQSCNYVGIAEIDNNGECMHKVTN